MLANLEEVAPWGTVLRRMPRPCAILMGKGPVSVLLALVVMEVVCVYGVMTVQGLGGRYRFCPVSEPPLATVWRAVGFCIQRVGVEL